MTQKMLFLMEGASHRILVFLVTMRYLLSRVYEDVRIVYPFLVIQESRTARVP